MATNTTRTVAVIETLDIPADFLWQTISDFEHIDRWSELEVRSIEGSGIGCKRTVKMATGALVTEQLLVCNPTQMLFSYGIVEPNPYPMHDYRSTIVVEKISAQQSRLHWSGEYRPADGIEPAKTDNLLRKVYSNGIQLLREHYLKTVASR